MRKKQFVIAIILFLSTFAVNAQNKIGRVTGKVTDSDQKGISGATVTVLNIKDSSLVKAAVTTKTGDFELEKIGEGNFILSISSAGKAQVYGQPFDLNKNKTSVELGTFELVNATQSLAGVTVTAKRPFIENKIDRTVVNVESAITSSGETALETLEKAPGVMVDNDGNISLKGKSGVIVLIDDKPTYLSAQDLANYLRSMTSSQIDQIEIMTQPPAKYDASGNSGVINIKLKKNKQVGYNGSVSASYIQARYPKTTNSVNMNYRKGSTNLFGQYTFTHWEGFNELNLDRYFGKQSDKDFDNLYDQYSHSKFKSNTHSARLGIDHSLTKKISVGASVNGVFDYSRGQSNSRSDFLNDNFDLISYNEAFSTNEGPWKNISTNLNFRVKLDSNSQELSGDLDYILYRRDSEQKSDNYNYNPDGSLIPSTDPIKKPNPYYLRGQLPGNIDIYTGKLDYSSKLRNEGRFEAGLKISYVKNDNDARYSYLLNGVPTYDSSRSNHFIYQENINAAYVNFNKQIKKWGIQVGLRGEATRVRGNQVIKNDRFDSSYFQLFPSIYVNYKATDKNTFGISYGRRIERPNYEDMNPFQYFLDLYTYRQGNPYLKPQISNNIELSYNYKGELNVTANFSNTLDVINDVLKQNDSTKVTFQTKENVSKRVNIGLSLNYNKTIYKWWTANVYASLFNNHFEGFVNEQQLSADVPTYLFNVNSQFRFGKGWGAEVSGFYRSEVLVSGTIVGRPMGVLSFGFSKQVLKNKGSIRLNIRDPFWFQKFSGYTEYGNINTYIHSQWDNRRVGITFTYRFSKGKDQPQVRQRSTSEEQNRAGGSSNSNGQQ